jgi:hypothetical protein
MDCIAPATISHTHTGPTEMDCIAPATITHTANGACPGAGRQKQMRMPFPWSSSVVSFFLSLFTDPWLTLFPNPEKFIRRNELDDLGFASWFW